MSIFKESFKDFVRKQLKIREAIISHGNDPKDSRNGSPKVNLSELGGPKDLVLPSNAFYTNTTNRQCTIRMSSGVDLREDNELITDNTNTMERLDDLKNEGLALRYVLEGGVPMIDKSVKQTATETGTGSDFDIKTTYKFKQGARTGFLGSSPNRFGLTYGDPSIRANPEIDQYGESYGIVPMPGIKSANIRTASAYGSLREAKVDFTCHNQRQLEILELLYMRPGYPVLLEWGWVPYINNEGERESSFPPIAQWWSQDSSMEEIQRLVIQRKIDTGGNYDGVVGYVKNFNYTARPDGGFDCTTELTGIGETIEALKGRADIYSTEEGIFTTALEEFLKNILAFSIYADRNTIDADEEQTAKDIDKFLIIDDLSFGLFSAKNFQRGFNWARKKILSAREAVLGYEPPTSVFDYLNFNWLKSHKDFPPVYDQYAEAYDRKITRSAPTIAEATTTADAQAAADAQAVAAIQAGVAAAGETSTVTDPGLLQQGFDAVSDLVGEGLNVAGEGLDALSETTGITGEDVTGGLASAAEFVGDQLLYAPITGLSSAELAASASVKAAAIAGATEELFQQVSDFASETADAIETSEEANAIRTKILENFMLRHDQSLIAEYDEDGDLASNIKSNSTYIRLDFFCHVMNQHIIEKNENGDSPIIYLKTDTIVHEDREIIKNPDGTTSTEGKHIEPFAYCTNTIDKNLKEAFKSLYDKAVAKDRVNGWFGIGNSELKKFYGDGAETINDGLDDIESLVEDDDVTEYIGSFDELIESDRIDMSIDPTVCLFPHQMKFLQNEKGTLSDTIDPFYKRVQPQFAYDGLGDPKNKNRNAKYDEYIELCNYDIEKEKPGIYDRQIGHIFLNVEHLLSVYRDMRYDVDISRGLTDMVRSNLDFNLFDFFKKILKDVNDASGGQHKFTLQTDHERPNVMNVVDLIFQPEEKITTEIKEGKIVELKIQSNDSVFRDFQYTSTVPSSLMATIGVVAQNPDAIGDLEQATYSALNVNVRQRFAQKPRGATPTVVLTGLDKETAEKQKKEAEEAAQRELFAERTAFEVSLLDTFKSYVNLKVFYKKVILGEYSKMDDEGNAKYSKEIGKQKQNLKTIINEMNKLSTRHLKDGTYLDNTEFKRGDVKRAPTQGVSDIIPLKFQAVVDGIGGIVIGSTFKINESRLPIVYRKTKGRQVLFICMTEEQNITAGQDWTTSFSGQLTLLGDDPTTQDTGTKKDKKGGTGGNVATGNGDAGSGGGGGQNKNKIKEEKEPIRENTDIEADVEEVPSQEEQQLNQQDQCPPGQYFDEENGFCVIESEAEVVEEDPKKAKARERYKQWRKQVIEYSNNGEWLGSISSQLFEQGDTAYTTINASKQLAAIYFAYFDNLIVNAKNIKTLSTYRGGSIGPELIELFNNDEELKGMGIAKPNSNQIITIPELVPTIEKIHNLEDPKMIAFEGHKIFISEAFEMITKARENPSFGTYVEGSPNELVIFEYKDYYGPFGSEPASTTNNSAEEENQQKLEALRGSGTQYVGVGTSSDESIAGNKAGIDARGKLLEAAGVGSATISDFVQVSTTTEGPNASGIYTVTRTFELI